MAKVALPVLAGILIIAALWLALAVSAFRNLIRSRG